MRAPLKRIAVLLCLFVLPACQLPEFRVGQQKVDPKLADKPPEQTEAERRAAEYLSLRSLVLEPDARQQLLDIHNVATPLSASLGKSQAPVTIEDKDAIIAALTKGILAAQKKDEAWKAFARKHAGRPIEGTGVDLAPWGGGAGVLLLVAGCIFVPGLGSFVLFVIKRLRGTIQQMAQGVEEYAIEHPGKAKELKEYFTSAMDRPAKAIVKREKKYLDETNLQELRQQAAIAAAAAATPATP
jgi:hypothetical protein